VIVEKHLDHQLDGVIAVKFVDRGESRDYNQRFAQQDYATDVLSFAYNEVESSPVTENALGDIVICTPIAAEQAQQYGIPLRAEITLLLVHGILHIAGFDHQHQESAAKTSFAQIQNAIMEELGLPAREYFDDHHH